MIDPKDYFLFEVGETNDIGLLELIAREVIIKSFARRDWAEHSEKWGQPRIVIKTDAEDNDLTVLQSGVANFARNGYAIVGIDDEIEKFDSTGTGAETIYSNNINLCDANIAKLINGQSGTGEEKAFVGSAEVSERILNDYHYSRLRRYSNVINYQLTPFLIYYGYPLTEATGRFVSLDTPQPPKGGAEPDSNAGESTNDTGSKQASAAKKKVYSGLAPW